MTSLHNSPTKHDWDIGKTRRPGTSRSSWQLAVGRVYPSPIKLWMENETVL